MHRALEIQEILLDIFYHSYTRSRTSDLAALARTCRAFTEPALDILWRELENLSPLVRCLPQASRRYPGTTYSFSRPLTQSEWDILQSYSRRIRSILDINHTVDSSFFSTVSNNPTPKPLFPNLHEIYCRVETHVPHLLCLSLPSLVTLSFDFVDGPLFRDSLDKIPEAFPNIKRFSFHINQCDVALGENISKCISQWRNLESLICPRVPLNFGALSHLSRMPALTRLDVMLRTALAPSNSHLLFSNLHDLTLRSRIVDPMSQLLSRIQLPAIVNFTAIIDHCPSRRELLSFLANVQTSGATHTCKTLRLIELLPPPHYVLESDEPLLGLGDLQHCMSFRNLRHIDLNICWNVGLTDDDLLTLTSAWPHLESLLINFEWGWNTMGGITPNGLLQLLQACRSLSRIALAIETRGYTKFLPSPGTFELKLPLTFSIDVLDSPIEQDSVPALANFFASIAPCPDFSFFFWDCDRRLDDDGREIYRDRWDDVYILANDIVRYRFL